MCLTLLKMNRFNLILFYGFLLVSSGLMIYGYPIVSTLLLFIYFIYNIKDVEKLKIKIDFFLIFFIYMFMQVLRGIFYLDDFRLIYWLLFFIITYISYIKILSYPIIGLNNKFAWLIYYCSSLYFILYFILGISIENPDEYQGIYWVGSSVAFIISIPLLASHNVLLVSNFFEKIAYWFSPVLLGLTSIVHDSRSGLYILFAYLFISLVTQFKFSIKSFKMLFLGVFLFFVVDMFGQSIYQKKPFLEKLYSSQEFVDTLEVSDQSLGGDLGRVIMIYSIIDKSLSSPIEFLFGSGWYTSRFSLIPFEIENRSSFNLSINHLTNGKSLQSIGIASIFSDTGIIGFLFFAIFYFQTSKQIFRKDNTRKYTQIFLLFSNFSFYLVGFTFVSPLSLLLILPSSILVILSKLRN